MRQGVVKVSGTTLITAVHNLRMKGSVRVASKPHLKDRVEKILWQAETRLLKVSQVGHGTTGDLKFLDELLIEMERLSDEELQSPTIEIGGSGHRDNRTISVGG